MEVTRYKVNAKCYPRYKAETGRLWDISRRLDTVWISTFGVRFRAPVSAQKIETETQNEYLDLFLFDRKGEKQISNTNGTDMVLHNQGIKHQDSYNYEDVDAFLQEKQHLLKSTSVLVFREHTRLRDEIENLLSQNEHVSVIVLSKQKLNIPPKSRAPHPNLKISTAEDIATDIGLMLEITAFKPWCHKFDILKRVTDETQVFASQRMKASATGQSNGLHGARCTTGPIFADDDSIENETGNHPEYNRQITSSMRLKSKKAKNTTSDETGQSNGLHEARSKTGTIKKNDDSIDNWTGDHPEHNGHITRSMKLMSKIETRTISDGTSDVANEHRTEKGIKRKSVALKECVVLSYDINVRQTRSGKLLSPPAVKTWIQEGKTVVNKAAQFNQQTHDILTATEGETIDLQRKFTENKHKFQRLLGEMVGMYKRSKLPEDCKPSLKDIPKEKVSKEMLSDLYNLSESVKGFGYRFGTRLQIFVLEADTEKLKQKIADKLKMHGIVQGSYDIVPPIDKSTPYSKLKAGTKIILNYGTLTGFIKMQNGQQGEDSYAVASKHVINGRKTIELANEEVKISADVLPETAPGDNEMLFDIALAKVKKDDEKHCEGKFENESGTEMKGIVCSYSDDQLEGKAVHINGASTEKGLGIISMTHYEMRIDENEKSNSNMEPDDEEESNQNEIHIVVEDRTEGVPFCKRGDSGSMVCADDEDGNHIQLISTVIGEWKPDSYITLRLTKGLAHLERQTKSRISFFE